ncbi:Aste57867_21034 [Aphanomyces stellatus]|uniref:Aste57867_21034 protein n=1 Tax=Aphanomyces stellatus TaxID=120398 RepID=A0A485LL65_9STRA|nr:hypothetical protein As57867_020966 [Aphanomyces stellatus]VFT97709.1 Aste57867_21034 [Aphanomyces stellatus]
MTQKLAARIPVEVSSPPPIPAARAAQTPDEALRTGREMLRDLWSFDSEQEDVSLDENQIRPSLQSSVSSASFSTTTDDQERTGISNLDVEFTFELGKASIIQQGWLVKRGHNWQTWKKRWFVLTSNGILEYFKKPNLKKSKGKVDINDGIVKIQFVDVHRVAHINAFYVLKGFYALLCSCETSALADEWVRNLRQVRIYRPLDYEGLTHHVDMFPTERATRALLDKSSAGANLLVQFGRFQRRVLSSASGYSPATASSILSVQSVGAVLESFSAGTILDYIRKTEQHILEHHRERILPRRPLSPSATEDDGSVSLDETLGVRVVLEDRIFLPIQDIFYKHLDIPSPTRVASHITTLRALPAASVFEPAVLAVADTDWSDVIATFAALDTVSLPSHKLHVFQRAVDLLGPVFSTSTAAYRYICVHASVENVAAQASILRLAQKRYTLSQLEAPTRALMDAVVWIANFNATSSPAVNPSQASVVSVSFATPEIGIQFLPQFPQERGARVHFVQKNSQANWSAAVQPGLVLLAVNDTFVAVSPLDDITAHIRTAHLPKRLVFMQAAEVDGFLTPTSYHHLLCGAAHRGDLSTVRYILSVCTSLDVHVQCTWRPNVASVAYVHTPVEETPLHAAVHGGHIDLVRYLLDELALNPNQLNSDHAAPLHLLESNIAEIAPLLVSRGALIDAPDKDGRTPLIVQCQAGSREGVVTLVGLGASVRSVAWATGMTPLLECTKLGFVALVDFLLLKGASVKEVTNERNSALHLAATTGHVDLIERLVQAGASLRQPNREGLIPAMVLLQKHQSFPSELIMPCLRLLVEDPVTMRCSDMWGRYVVHFATALPPKIMKEAMELCLEKGANGHVEDIFGDSAKEYRKHPKEHGEYVAPTNFMRHLHVTLVELENKRSRIQNGKIEDILGYLIADKSTNLTEIVSFILSFQAYMDVPELFALFKTKYGHHDAKYTLKHAWSVVAGGSFLRDNHCGGLLFLSLLGVLFPHVVGMETFAECAQVLDSSVAAVQTYMAKFSFYYNLGTPTTLYVDLYQHMIEMYANKQNDRNLPMQRLKPTTSAFDFARQCTLLSHALFCRIPIRQLLSHKSQDVGFLSSSHWHSHVSCLVVNYVLSEATPIERARVFCFFIDVAEISFTAFQNFDTFIAIVSGLQSTPIFRLKITYSHISPAYIEKLQKLRTYTQSGSREMNRVMKTVQPPCVPYLGLYMQNIVGLNELPKYEEDSFVNFNRLRMLGSMAQDLMKYQAVTFSFHSCHAIEEFLHVTLPYPSDDERHKRSHELESKGAIEVFVDEETTQQLLMQSSSDATRDSSLSSSPQSSSWTARLRLNSTASVPRRDRLPSYNTNIHPSSV